MKKLLFALYILLCNINCTAQVTVTMSQLLGTKWTIDGEGKVGEDTVVFYADHKLNIAYYSLVKITTKFKTPYYLSDSMPKSFDHSKVGTSTSGRYLVEYNTKLERMTVIEVRELDLDKGKMVLYSPYIRNAFRDGTITYRMLSPKYHQASTNEILFNNPLPEKTLKQEGNADGVATAVASLISLAGSEKSAEDIRTELEMEYTKIKEDGYLYCVDGVKKEDIDTFMNKAQFSKTPLDNIVGNIKSGNPCAAVIDTENGLQMIGVVGYYDYSNGVDSYQCINPRTGLYETHSKQELQNYPEMIYVKCNNN